LRATAGASSRAEIRAKHGLRGGPPLDLEKLRRHVEVLANALAVPGNAQLERTARGGMCLAGACRRLVLSRPGGESGRAGWRMRLGAGTRSRGP